MYVSNRQYLVDESLKRTADTQCMFGGWIFKKNSRHAVYVSNSQCLVYESLKRRTNDYYMYVYIVHLINRTIAEHGKGAVQWNVYLYICKTNLYTKCIYVMSNGLSCSFASCLTTIYTDDEIGRDWKKHKWGGVIPVNGIPNLHSNGRIYINRQWRYLHIFAFTRETTNHHTIEWTWTVQSIQHSKRPGGWMS